MVIGNYRVSFHQLVLLVLCLSSMPLLAKSLSPQEMAHLPINWRAQTPHHVSSPHGMHGPGALTPAQIKKAYGFPPELQGAGQTIAIVDAFDNPNIEADLNTFSSQFGLPACTTANGCFKKLFAQGTLPPSETGWGIEIALDVEWAHAIAPLAKIILVEAEDNGLSLFDAIQFAIQQKPSVISLSWGYGEWSDQGFYDKNYFQAAQIPIFAATGDYGNGTWYPATSPYVTAVGGTELFLDANGNYLAETAWTGSSGGISTWEYEPSFQSAFPIAGNLNKMRGVPDVAYNSGGHLEYSVYDSFGYGGWINIYGTSAAAPQWAALVAIMKAAKKGNFANLNGTLYSVGRATNLWHDVTSGSNGSCGYICQSRSGYDYVTGLGTPQPLNLINRFK